MTEFNKTSQASPGAKLDRRFREKRSFEIKQLWDQHQEILRRLALGERPRQIASDLGITTQTVSNTRNSQVGREKLQELHSRTEDSAIDVGERIRSFAPAALQLLESIITGEEPGASLALRAKVASQHLGRAGYGEVHKSVALNGTLSRSDIEKLKERALRGAKESGLIIDTEATEVPSDGP